MHFGVAFHHEYTWWWWQTAFRCDSKGPNAGKMYDGRLTLADGKGTWWEGYDPKLLYGINSRLIYYVATFIVMGLHLNTHFNSYDKDLYYSFCFMRDCYFCYWAKYF